MIIRIILAGLILTTLFYGYAQLKKLPPKKRKALLFKYVFWAILILLIAAVLTGRLHWLGAAVAALFGIAKFGLSNLGRLLPMLGFLRRTGTFGNPKFSTPHLEAQINIETGEISGSILSGPHSGKCFSELTPDQLNELVEFYRDKDLRSHYLIRVLQQRAGSTQQHSREDYSNVRAPSIQEAEQVLGLNKGYSRQDVIHSHRKLIQKLHPDRGGNDYLASRVNQAKDVLLKHLEK
ncbi:molecular chaperone DnaJ [Teredinibacter sp. KSP-S5-2]|uniref:molecular chaperone DnaJ n=1 Tax=Teredinibacter sp. KSP-S5-2 TaxID=3034506 RepID=UPI0029345C20|nr:molecular chaperone DnaJ [Teredinibacter sp. KSP-S5-2]WNO07714.1 molecular chaperone DnaJ [Teredinibacter sp. KSP-S5-2]